MKRKIFTSIVAIGVLTYSLANANVGGSEQKNFPQFSFKEQYPSILNYESYLQKEKNKIIQKQEQQKLSEVSVVPEVKVKEVVQEVKVQEVKKVKEVKIQGEKRTFKDVPLNDDLQEYICKRSDQENIPCTLSMAIAKLESNFNVNIPVSKTDDHGLFQIHGSNFYPSNPNNFTKQMGLQSFNPKNPYENANMAIWYLGTIEKSWDGKGLSEKDKTTSILLSYNRGIVKASSYIRNNGYKPDNYVSIISKTKDSFERE